MGKCYNFKICIQYITLNKDLNMNIKTSVNIKSKRYVMYMYK